ncbi:MAG: hypothetical protein ACD_9C00205G0002 [uncultured bacterium]|nr:MAG: hypothetical protein ACD_9C00205G0002 [uncultured bacterium]
MNKFYITGIPGVGKSSVLIELNKKGIRAIDLDEISDLCCWKDESGERADYYPGMGKEWLDKNSYVCDLEKLKMILNDESDDLVIAGIVTNQEDLLRLFDKVFLLRCDEKIFLERLNTRDTNDFAKNESDQQHILGFYKEFEVDMIKHGAIPINTNVSLDEVVEKIIFEMKNID